MSFFSVKRCRHDYAAELPCEHGACKLAHAGRMFTEGSYPTLNQGFPLGLDQSGKGPGFRILIGIKTLYVAFGAPRFQVVGCSPVGACN